MEKIQVLFQSGFISVSSEGLGDVLLKEWEILTRLLPHTLLRNHLQSPHLFLSLGGSSVFPPQLPLYITASSPAQVLKHSVIVGTKDCQKEFVGTSGIF